MPTLIIITGHPGSGKTTIAKQLSERHHIPYLSKDAFKERIFDGLGSKDKEWSLQVSGVAHRIMDDLAGQLLNIGSSVILESNFKHDIDSDRFTHLAAAHTAEIIQILCIADGSVLFDRWNSRITTGERHEGHVEAIPLDQIKQDLAQPYPPLDLPGKLVTIDTTDFGTVVLPGL